MALLNNSGPPDLATIERGLSAPENNLSEKLDNAGAGLDDAITSLASVMTSGNETIKLKAATTVFQLLGLLNKDTGNAAPQFSLVVQGDESKVQAIFNPER